MEFTPPRFKKPRLAFWFRYGAAEHMELCYALPEILKVLSRHFDITYISLTSREKPTVPESIRAYADYIQCPLTISRLSNRDKWIKSLIWIFFTPLLSLWTRMKGIKYVYVDETLPMMLPLARPFFRDCITLTVADLFLNQYFDPKSRFTLLGRMLLYLDLRAWNRCPFIITRAASSQALLREMGVSKPDIFHSYDAVDEEVYHPRDKAICRTEWGWLPSQIIMVFHGVLHPNKNLSFIINSLPDIVADHPDFFLMILGNGPEEDRLKMQTMDLQLESHIQFMGYTPPRHVATALCAGDIGLVTRRGDPGDHLVITSVLGHCLASGLPVLASRQKGISEIIEHGKNGLLFEPEDTKDFKAQLNSLIVNAELRKLLSTSGLQTVSEKLSVSESAERNASPLIKYWAGENNLKEEAST